MKTKHLYVFRIKCEQCGNPYSMKLELYEYMDPEWLIKSVPIKNICKRCNVQFEVKRLVLDIKQKKFGTESLLLDGKGADRGIRWSEDYK